MDLALISASYLIVVVTTYALIKGAERNRLPRLKRSANHIQEGRFPEGGNMLLWDPGDLRTTMSLSVLMALLLLGGYLLWGYDGIPPDPLVYAILSSSLIFAIVMAYHFAYYYRRSARRIIVVNDRGIEVAFMQRGGLRSGYRYDWEEIEDVFLAVGTGGGTTFSGSDNGIIIKAPTKNICVDRHLKNAHLFFAWLVRKFPREFFSYNVFDYLWHYSRSVDLSRPQEFLNTQSANPYAEPLRG